MISWLRRRFGIAEVQYTSHTPWDQRSREEKRQTAPYALGFEEGYASAYEQFVQTGTVMYIGSKGIYAYHWITRDEMNVEVNGGS